MTTFTTTAMRRKALKSFSILFLLTLMFNACDRDFSSIQSDIEGSENFNTNSKKFPVVAFNKKLNPVQTNVLTANLMGVYNDNVYGLTTASVVTQIIPTTFSPDFGEDPELESVIMTVPYFVSNDGTDDDGNTIYSIDSLWGEAPIKLEVYRNNYFLRDFDPENAEEIQKYYSNSGSTIDFDSHLGELLYEDTSFIPDPSEIIIEEENEETGELEEVERIQPSIRVELLNPGDDFWETLLFFDDEEDITHPELSNQNNFKEYFRGLYFRAEAIEGNGSMLMLDFSRANIILNYTNVIDPDTGERDESFIRFNFTGNRLNVLDNDPTNTVIDDADAMADEDLGDERLYLKGGEGSMAVIDLFNGDVVDETSGMTVPAYDFFTSRKDSWLINEANLVFKVDQDQVDDEEPDRVILIDLKNNLPIVDFFIDRTTNNFDPINSKINYSEILERDEDGNGVSYKIRLTEHINNMFIRDSTNVKLGLFVSTNINEIVEATLIDSEDEVVSSTPIGSVISPKGTILKGSNENVPEEDRVQLEIFYTCISIDDDCPDSEE